MKKILCILMVAIMFLQPLTTVFALSAEENTEVSEPGSEIPGTEEVAGTEEIPEETNTEPNEEDENLENKEDEIITEEETQVPETDVDPEGEDAQVALQDDIELFYFPDYNAVNKFYVNYNGLSYWEEATGNSFSSTVAFMPKLDEDYDSKTMRNAVITVTNSNSDNFTFSIELIKYAPSLSYAWVLYIEPGDIGINGKKLDCTVTVKSADGEELFSHTFNDVDFQLPRMGSDLELSDDYTLGSIVLDAADLGITSTQTIKLKSSATFDVDLTNQPPVEIAWSVRFDRDIATLYPMANLDFYGGNYAVFKNTGTLRIMADEDTYLYQIDKNNKLKITPLNATYNKSGGYYEFKTNTLGRYLTSDKPLSIISIPTSERVAKVDTNFYFLNEDTGIVEAASKNLPHSIDEGIIYFPLLKSNGQIVTNELAGSYISVEMDNEPPWPSEPYFETYGVVSKSTNIGGKVETAYFFEVYYYTEKEQSNYTLNVTLSRNHNDNLNFSTIKTTLKFKAGYRNFTINSTAKELNFTNYTGPVKINLAGTKYAIYADVTNDKKIKLSFTTTAPAEVKALFPNGASLNYISIASDKGFSAPAEMDIYPHYSGTLYEIEENGNLNFFPAKTSYGYASIVSNKFGSYVMSSAQPLPPTDTSPQRAYTTADKFYVTNASGVVVENSSTSLDFDINQKAYIPLLTENGDVVSLPEAVEDLIISTYFVRGTDFPSIPVVEMNYNFEGKTGTGYFIELDFSYRMFFAADYVFEFGIVKNSGQDNDGKSLKTIFISPSFGYTISSPISTDWTVTSLYKTFKFPTTGSDLINFDFEEFDATFSVDVAGAKKAVLKANKEENKSVKAQNPDANLSFFNIVLNLGSVSSSSDPNIPGSFIKTGTLTLTSPGSKYFYRINLDKSLELLATSNNGTFTCKARTLGNFVASDIELDLNNNGNTEGGNTGGGNTGGGNTGGGNTGGGNTGGGNTGGGNTGGGNTGGGNTGGGNTGSGNTGGGNTGGGSGNKSSGSKSPSTTATTPTEIVFKPATSEAALLAIKEGVTAAKTSGNTTAYARLLNTSTVTLEQIKSMKAASDRTLRINADSISLSRKGVEVRIAFWASTAVKDLDLSASTTSARAKQTSAFFAKWFKNKFATVSMGHQGQFGMTVSIAAQIDLSGMNTSNLYFYSYDRKTNLYNRILKPNYYVDSVGYLWFETTLGGEVVVSDGPLELK